MTFAVVIVTLISAVAVAALTSALMWLLRQGKTEPGAAYVSPFATGWVCLLALGLLAGAIANAIYGAAPQWLTFGAATGALLLGVCTSYWLAFRIEWDEDGFRTRGLGRSFSAAWSQVVAAREAADWAYRLELDHPNRKRFEVSALLVGSRQFHAMAESKLAQRRAAPEVTPPAQ